MKDDTTPSASDICITGLGLVTAVGHDCTTACASIQAGINRARKLNHVYIHDKRGYEDFEDGLVTGHAVLDENEGDRKSRIITLLSMALSDLKENAGLDETLFFSAQMYLALPDRDSFKIDEDVIMKDLKSMDVWSFSGDDSVLFYPKGHAAMLYAMADASEALRNNDITRAVIAGSDSYIGFDDLINLNDLERLKTLRNPDGLIPGEAAAAILIEKRSTAKSSSTSIKSIIKGVETAKESPDSPGSGLAKAIRALITKESVSVASVITDMNGETHRVREWGMVQSKTFHQIPGAKDLMFPVRQTGDTGAASAGIAICLATNAMKRDELSSEPGQSKSALIVSSSDTQDRAALLLSMPGDP